MMHIEQVAGTMQTTTQVVATLDQASSQIESIVHTQRDRHKQTTLLALNAALKLHASANPAALAAQTAAQGRAVRGVLKDVAEIGQALIKQFAHLPISRQTIRRAGQQTWCRRH
jgi:hypothetical protein